MIRLWYKKADSSKSYILRSMSIEIWSKMFQNDLQNELKVTQK